MNINPAAATAPCSRTLQARLNGCLATGALLALALWSHGVSAAAPAPVPVPGKIAADLQ